MFEGWVRTLLRAYAEERELYDEIFYWSPAQARQTEVDFLLRRGEELLALEVKWKRRFTRDLLSGLLPIGDLTGVVRRVLLYAGSRELKTQEGIEVWPVRRFLEALGGDDLWP